MKNIGFIGAYDKTDFVLYVAKILVESGQRVLFVDATLTQKARYIVPNIQPSRAYITEFEGIDVAVGMRSFDDIKTYLRLMPTNELPYDIALIDTDSAGGAISYRIGDCEKIFFVTSFDMYSIRRGIESIAGIQHTVNATKVLFSRSVNKADDDFINYLSSGSNIIWNKDVLYFPFELGDQTVIYKNQRVSKIKLRELSSQYKEGLMYIVSQILEENNYQQLRKIFKKVEKGT